MTAHLSYQFRLHFIVLIFGFTGILGKLIDLPALQIVVYRTFIACVALRLYFLRKNIPIRADGKDVIKWLATGIVVGMHWFCFFESIKLSTVSVALVSLSSTALFTAILEPIFLKKRFMMYELLFSALIIAGMSLVLQFEFRYAVGIAYGVACALLASLFTVLNSRYVAKTRASVISFYELTGGFVFMLALSSLSAESQLISELPDLSDVFYLLMLGLFATAFAFVVSVSVMKQLTPFTVSLTINLEPLYGILLALLIFGEEEWMSPGFYVGFTLILGTILLNAYMKRSKGPVKVGSK